MSTERHVSVLSCAGYWWDDRNGLSRHGIMTGFALAAQGARDILITRNFPAPAARVFEALTQPEIGGDQNLNTMALVDACYASAREHKVISFK